MTVDNMTMGNPMSNLTYLFNAEHIRELARARHATVSRLVL
jgi:hypothetical protein